MLTGKAKEDFKEWLCSFGNGIKRYPYKYFRELDPSMQWGVYVDFFDSVEIRIEMQLHVDPTMQGGFFKNFRPVVLDEGRFINCRASFMDRSSARKAAIEKANEIYNSK